MIAPLDPIDAYRQDLAAASATLMLGEHDHEWLGITHGVRRLEQLSSDRRRAAARDLSRAIADSSPSPRAEAVARALAMEPSDWGGADAVDALRELAAEMEEGSAYRLAFTLLASFRALLPERAWRAEGLIVAQQGRIARQLGDLEAAESLYRSAQSFGEEEGDQEVVVRALLGRGAAAAMRGNFPEARTLFREALSAATAAGLRSYASGAHHGLFRWALSAGDLDEAFHHGWEAFREAFGDASRRAELLTNLGEVCLLARRPAPALRAYRVALRLTPLARIRLAAIGGAVLAAARLGERGVLEELAAEAEREVAGSGQPYENAVTLVELAEAYSLVGERHKRERYRARALRVAEQFGYFEVVHRAEMLPRDVNGRGMLDVTPVPLHETSLDVLRQLEQLDIPAAVGAGH